MLLYTLVFGSTQFESPCG